MLMMTARGHKARRARASPDKGDKFNCQDKTLLQRREGYVTQVQKCLVLKYGYRLNNELSSIFKNHIWSFII